MAPRTRSQWQAAGSPLKAALESEPRRNRPRSASSSAAASGPSSTTVAKSIGSKISKKSSSSKKSKTSRKFLALLENILEDDAMLEHPQEESSTHVPSIPQDDALLEDPQDDAMHKDSQEESSTQIRLVLQAHTSPQLPSIQPGGYRTEFFQAGPSSSPLSSPPLSSPTPIVVAKARRGVASGGTRKTVVTRKKARRPVARASPMPNSDDDHYTPEEFTVADALIRDYENKAALVPSCGTCKSSLVKVFFCTTCNKVAQDPASHSSCSSHPQDKKLTQKELPVSRKRSIEETEQDSVPAAKRQDLGVNHTSSAITPSRKPIRPFNTDRPARRTWFPPKSSEVAIEWQKATVNGKDLFEAISRGGVDIPVPPRNKGKEVEADLFGGTQRVSQPQIEPAGSTSPAAVQDAAEAVKSPTTSSTDATTKEAPHPTSFLQRVLPRFFSPKKPERPIIQTRQPSALNPGTGNLFSSAVTGSMQSTSAVDDENVHPVGGPVVKRAGRHASQSTLRMPKRFEHRPPLHSADDNTAGATTAYKIFASEEEFMAEVEKTLEARQKTDQTKQWLRQKRMKQREERAEEEGRTGEKRKRQPHNTRVEYMGYQAGRTADGRGFSADITHLSTDESDDSRDMITLPNQNDSSPGSSQSSPATTQDASSNDEPPTKRLKFVQTDNVEEKLRDLREGGVKTMPDGTRHFPDGSISYPDGRIEFGVARGRWDSEREAWVPGVPDRSHGYNPPASVRRRRNPLVAQQKANADAAKLRKEIEEDEALENKRNPQAISFGIPDDFFDFSGSEEDEADFDDTTPAEAASGSLSTPELGGPSISTQTPANAAPEFLSTPKFGGPSISAQAPANAASSSFSTPELGGPSTSAQTPADAASGSLSTPDLSGPSTSAQTPADAPSGSLPTTHLNSPSTSEPHWTQPPPSRPTPAHALLPDQETDTLAKPPTEQEMALAISKQLAAVQKYKPANPSHLRQERTVDSPLAVVSNREDHAWRREVRHAIMSIDPDKFEDVEFPATSSYVEAGVVNVEIQEQLDLDFPSDPYAKDQLDKEFDDYMAAADLIT